MSTLSAFNSSLALAPVLCLRKFEAYVKTFPNKCPIILSKYVWFIYRIYPSEIGILFAINIIAFCPLVFSRMLLMLNALESTSNCKWCYRVPAQRYESIRSDISVLICSRLRLKKSNNNSCNRFWWLRPQNNRLNLQSTKKVEEQPHVMCVCEREWEYHLKRLRVYCDQRKWLKMYNCSTCIPLRYQFHWFHPFICLFPLSFSLSLTDLFNCIHIVKLILGKTTMFDIDNNKRSIKQYPS